jgi:hypothetical protein
MEVFFDRGRREANPRAADPGARRFVRAPQILRTPSETKSSTRMVSLITNGSP